MITRVRVVRFKRFADQVFDLTGTSILLAGPNNSGKTTLLHAIAAWHLALKRWLAERGKSGGKRRISVVLDEFTALPLREMNLLWLNRHTARKVPGKKQPTSAPIYIQVTSAVGRRVEESLTIEFMYANEKMVYVRPVMAPDDPQPIDELPEFAQDLNVVHVPAFSGIGTQEPRHAPGIQHKLVGEGKPGEIVRNLLLEIWEASEKKPGNPPWKELQGDIERLFQCELLPPEFSDARPYVVCEYRPKPNPADRSSRPPKLDIANAGSGFHQVLLLLAFFHARRAAVLLLDEPDAHLHFILQREIFDHLRLVAHRRSCKLIVATHAEVLLSGEEPEQIISFIGQSPRRLLRPEDKQRVQEALRRLTALDLLQADHVRAVLYVEDESDYKLLHSWANVLKHRAADFLRFPYVVPLHGKGNFDEAKKHFQCLRLAQEQIRGLAIVDRDAADQVREWSAPAGLAMFLWGRYEIENYLLMPTLIKRYLQSRHAEGALFAQPDEQLVDDEFAANFPAGIDFLKDIPALRDLKASDFLVHLLGKTQFPLPKRDLYMLADIATPDEIHFDVVKALDHIAAILPGTVPSIEANAAPIDVNGTDDATEGTNEV
ncbi:MAG TPA: AAA family ATPase [Pirellulales bacterium]|nr:AAA family ATPase [Pirellulales bacterium]